VLLQAAMLFHEPYCSLLINNNADINARQYGFSSKGRRCLHLACLTDSFTGTRKLYPRSVDYIKFLISKGANIDVQDDEGKTPLCLAVESDWFDGVRVLMETPSPSKMLIRNK